MSAGTGFNQSGTSSGGTVTSVNSGTDIIVDNTDPSNPIVNVATVFIDRVTNLEENELKITYYSIITGASGTVTAPSQATFNSGEFGLSGNAVLSKIDGSNKPTFQSPTTAGGVVVTASLNTTTGAWVASGVYTDTSVAIIYSLKIKTIYYSNLNYFYIIESESVESSIVNPTNTFIPYNNAGVFADSWLKQIGADIILANTSTFSSEDGSSIIYLNNGNLSMVGFSPITGYGGNFNSSDISMYMAWAGATGSGTISINNFENAITHTVKLSFSAPIYEFPNGTASKLLYLDASQLLKPVTLGTGLSLVVDTLSATGGVTPWTRTGSLVTLITATDQVAIGTPTAWNAGHRLEIVASGTDTPLVMVGGSGAYEYWKDQAGGSGLPSKAIAVGLNRPGNAAGDDIVFSTYTSGTWTQVASISNLYGNMALEGGNNGAIGTLNIKRGDSVNQYIVLSEAAGSPNSAFLTFKSTGGNAIAMGARFSSGAPLSYVFTDPSGSDLVTIDSTTGALTLGIAGTRTGLFKLTGVTSGTVTIQTASVAGTWALTLPITGGTNKYALTTNGSGVSTWSQLDLTAGVTGVLPIANGGSNAATIAVARVNFGLDKTTNGGNTAYNILTTDKTVVTGTAFTAPRIWTLPDASTVNAGYEIIVADMLQTVTSTNTLTIAVQSGQALNGATNGTEAIASAGGWRRLVSDGVSNWTFDKGIVRASKNLSDLASASTSVTNLGLSSAAGLNDGSFGVTYNGLGGVITVNNYTQLTFNYACTITGFIINSINPADGTAVSGSIVIDIKRSGASIIGAGNKPTLSSQSSASAAASSWTSFAVAAGDVLIFYVVSASTVLEVECLIQAIKT